MSENEELTKLENEWKTRFEKFTTPEPTRDMTLGLIEKIRENGERQLPMDLRNKLDYAQNTLSVKEKIANLFLSQWNFYGATSWFLTGIIMMIITFAIRENSAEIHDSFTTWITWITLLVVAVIAYSFRPKTEANEILERLSYYPLVLQMCTRFIMIMGLQVVIMLPLSLFIVGKENTILYVVSTFIPVFFFGAVGFVATFWLGQKIGLSLTLIIWLSQAIVKNKLLFQVPSNDNFFLVSVIIFGLSVLLLSSTLLRVRTSRGLT